jgi:hypothetical protein
MRVMRARGSAAALAVLVLISATGAARSAPGPGLGPPPGEPETPEILFDLLLPGLEAALRAARAAPAFDPVQLIEAEETAAVAEELLAEGEGEVAVELLEQAIALLPAAPPE